MYQEDTETNRGLVLPNMMTNPFFRGSFETQHTKIEHVPIMTNRELEHGSYSQHQEPPRNDKEKEKDHDTDEE